MKVAILSIFVILISVFMVGFLRPKFFSVEKRTASSTIDPTPSPTVVTYQGSWFSFDYPSNYSLKEEREGMTVSIKLPEPSKEISIYIARVIEYDLLSRNKKTGEIKLNNIKWNYLSGEGRSYCDAGDCSGIADAIQTSNSDYRINVIPQNMSYKDDIIKQILATFRLTNKCVISGCNGELCLDKEQPDVASICLWQEKFACYKSATCEKQTDGKCGWTQTPQLKTCLQ